MTCQKALFRMSGLTSVMSTHIVIGSESQATADTPNSSISKIVCESQARTDFPKALFGR